LKNVTVEHAGDRGQYVLIDNSRNARVRQAVSLAIDRDDLVTDAVHGVGTPGVVPIVARGASWALSDDTVQSLTASLDAQPGRARQLLAGVPEADKTVTIQGPSGDTESRNTLHFVERALDAVGMHTHEVDLKDGAFGELFIGTVALGTDPFATLNTLSQQTKPIPKSYTAQLDDVHTRLQQLTESGRVVGLFEPDTLQAFRSDHVTGWLPEPQQGGLVVFGPTVAQYGALSAARVAPGERAGSGTYALGAVIVLALCAAVYWFASRIRRRYVTAEGNDVSN
jgi:ABC-type transport system substrate-binding protein